MNQTISKLITPTTTIIPIEIPKSYLHKKIQLLVVPIFELFEKTDDIYESNTSDTEWDTAAAQSPSFDFLQDQSENIYTLNDGKAIYENKT